MKDSYLLTAQITLDVDNYLPNFYMSAMDGSSEIYNAKDDFDGIQVILLKVNF